MFCTFLYICLISYNKKNLYDKIDFELIEDIVRWRVAAIEDKGKPNEKTYEYKAVIQSADRIFEIRHIMNC